MRAPLLYSVKLVVVSMSGFESEVGRLMLHSDALDTAEPWR